MADKSGTPKKSKRGPLLPWILFVGVVGTVAVVAYGPERAAGVGKAAAGVGRPVRKHSGRPDLAYPATDDPSVKVDQLGPRVHRVIDIHEHVQSPRDLEMLLAAMDDFKIQRTCLIASTIYTFTLNNKWGFEQYKENNEAIIGYRKEHPDRLCAFVTLDPEEDGNLERLQDYVSRGADGLKLYLGHGARHGKGPFHSMPLDDPRMEPIYEWAEKVQLPILMHVNLIKYFDELVRVLEKHPYLRLCVPHFGLHKNTKARLDRLAWLLERYPNVYTDMSFGWYEFHIEGFEALARWRSRSKKYLTKHADKIMYASDMVIEKTKDRDYVWNTLRSYFQLLEQKRLRLFLKDQWNMWGLDMDEPALKQIYWETPATYLQLNEDGSLYDRASMEPKKDADGNVVGFPPTVREVPKLPPERLMRGEGSGRN